MKKGNELGIAPIKCTNKEGSECIRDLHFQLNAILYKWSHRYISPTVANRLIGRLESIGRDLAKLEVSPKCEAKKQELLQKTREIYKNVRYYFENYKPSENDGKQALATAKYQISQYLRDKDNLTREDVITLLEDNRDIYQCVLKPLQITYTPYNKMQDELLYMLTKQYQLE